MPDGSPLSDERCCSCFGPNAKAVQLCRASQNSLLIRAIKDCASSSVLHGYTVVMNLDFSTTYSWRNSLAMDMNSTVGLVVSGISSPPFLFLPL